MELFTLICTAIGSVVLGLLIALVIIFEVSRMIQHWPWWRTNGK